MYRKIVRPVLHALDIAHRGCYTVDVKIEYRLKVPPRPPGAPRRIGNRVQDPNGTAAVIAEAARRDESPPLGDREGRARAVDVKVRRPALCPFLSAGKRGMLALPGSACARWRSLASMPRRFGSAPPPAVKRNPQFASKNGGCNKRCRLCFFAQPFVPCRRGAHRAPVLAASILRPEFAARCGHRALRKV